MIRIGVPGAALACVMTLAALPAFGAMSPDAAFATAAAQGGMAEVQSARLALTKSTNPTVTAFARRMIADHTPNNAKLAAIMRSEGMAVPAMVDPNSRAMMAKLQGLSGAAFNSAYMSGQVNAHAAMQTLMQSEANGGKDPKLVAYAKTTLSAVNTHLAMARSDVAMLKGGAMNGMRMNGGAMRTNGGSTLMNGGSKQSGNATAMPASTMMPGTMSTPGMSPGGNSPSGPNPMASATPH